MNKAKKPAKKSNKKTSDAIKILKNRYAKNDPQMARMIAEERANIQIARKICDLRTRAELSQRELAKLVGTTASVICRLEDADYEGHSLSMLHRIAAALGRRVEIRFLPLGAEKQTA